MLSRVDDGPETSSPGLRPWRWRILFWAGLVFAFGPSLRDAGELFVAQPWSRATLVFPVLAYAAARAEAPSRPSRYGWALVAVGIAIQMVAIGGGLVRVGRVGFVLAAMGLCRGAGWCSPPVALLLAFLLPIPHAVQQLGSPWLEAGLARLAASCAGALGLAVVHGRPGLESGASTLPLAEHDGGVGLAVSFLGLAWFAWLRAPGRDRGRLVRLAFVALLAAGGFQLASLTVAAIVLARGGEEPVETARAILDRTPWILVWSSGMVLAWTGRRAIGGSS